MWPFWHLAIDFTLFGPTAPRVRQLPCCSTGCHHIDASCIPRGPDRRGSHDVCSAPTHSTGAADVLVQGSGAVADELVQSPDYEAASTSSRAQCSAARPSVAG